MNYPHVEELYYRPVHSEDVDYDNASPAFGETEDFRWQLSKEQLVIQMKTHCVTVYKAREIVDQYLKAWEVTAGLLHGHDNLAFTFSSSTIVDHSWSGEKNQDGYSDQDSSETILLVDKTHVSHDKFPPFPQNFKVSPEVEMMFLRYKLYRQGREPLLKMAYWCLMVMEYSAGGRLEAADLYRVDHRVLRKLLELCWSRGEVTLVRRLKGHAGITVLKPSEKVWIRAVIKRLIVRAGEYAFDPTHKQPMITMADFPIHL